MNTHSFLSNYCLKISDIQALRHPEAPGTKRPGIKKGEFMKTTNWRSLGFLLLAAVGLQACDESPLTEFVQRTVKLQAVESYGENEQVFQGQLAFTVSTTQDVKKRVCEWSVCGQRRERRCDALPDCMPNTTSSRNPHQTDPRWADSWRSPFGPLAGLCRPTSNCYWETVPVYCDTNCRDVVVPETTTRQVPSTIVVRLEGQDVWDFPSRAIESLELGVGTNAAFAQALADSSKRPAGFEPLFDRLDRGQRTLLLMKAKGLVLSPVSGWLKIPEDFKPGQTLEMTVRVAHDRGVSVRDYSVAGTPVSFPSLDSRQ